MVYTFRKSKYSNGAVTFIALLLNSCPSIAHVKKIFKGPETYYTCQLEWPIKVNNHLQCYILNAQAREAQWHAK